MREYVSRVPWRCACAVLNTSTAAYGRRVGTERREAAEIAPQGGAVALRQQAAVGGIELFAAALADGVCAARGGIACPGDAPALDN